MANVTAEFNAGATPCSCPPLVLNSAPPAPSHIKADDFNGAHPRAWTNDSNLDNGTTNRVKDFNNPMGKEYIPAKASISGMV